MLRGERREWGEAEGDDDDDVKTDIDVEGERRDRYKFWTRLTLIIPLFATVCSVTR